MPYTAAFLLKLYAAMAAVFVLIDLTWLGVVARGFYARHLGPLMRPQANWTAAILFYLIYLVAVLVLCVLPALEKGSLARAVGTGALFGLAAYAAFDLTSLALFNGFSVTVVAVDLLWGVVLTGSVAAAGFRAAQLLQG